MPQPCSVGTRHAYIWLLVHRAYLRRRAAYRVAWVGRGRGGEYVYQPYAYTYRVRVPWHTRSRLCADDSGFDFERWRLHTSPSRYIRLLGGSFFGVTFRRVI